MVDSAAFVPDHTAIRVASGKPNPTPIAPFRLFTLDVDSTAFQITEVEASVSASPPRMRFSDNLLKGITLAPYAGKQAIIVPLGAEDPFRQVALYTTNQHGVPFLCTNTLGDFDELSGNRAPELRVGARVSPGARYAILWSHDANVIKRYWDKLTEIVRQCLLPATSTKFMRDARKDEVRAKVEEFACAEPFFVFHAASDMSFASAQRARAEGHVAWLDVRDSDEQWCSEWLTSVVGDVAMEARLGSVSRTWQALDAATYLFLMLCQQAGLAPYHGLVPVAMLRALSGAIHHPADTGLHLSEPSRLLDASPYVQDTLFSPDASLPGYCLQLYNPSLGVLYMMELLDREMKRRMRNGWGGTGLSGLLQVADSTTKGEVIASLHARLVSALSRGGAGADAEALATEQAAWIHRIAQANVTLRDVGRIKELEWAVGALSREAPVARIAADREAALATLKATPGGALQNVEPSPIYFELARKGSEGCRMGGGLHVSEGERLDLAQRAFVAELESISTSYFNQYLFGMNFNRLEMPAAEGGATIALEARKVSLKSNVKTVEAHIRSQLGSRCTADRVVLAWLHQVAGKPESVQWGLDRLLRLAKLGDGVAASWAALTVPPAQVFGKQTLRGHVKPANDIVQGLGKYYSAASETIFYRMLEDMGGVAAKPKDLVSKVNAYAKSVSSFVSFVGGPPAPTSTAAVSTVALNIVAPLDGGDGVELVIRLAGGALERPETHKVPVYFLRRKAQENVAKALSSGAPGEIEATTVVLRAEQVAAARETGAGMTDRLHTDTRVLAAERDALEEAEIKRLLANPDELASVSKRASEAVTARGLVVPAYMNALCGLAGTAVALADYATQWEKASGIGRIAIVVGITKEFATTAANFFGAAKIAQTACGGSVLLSGARATFGVKDGAAGYWEAAAALGGVEARFVKIANGAGAIVNVMQGLDLLVNPEGGLRLAEASGDLTKYRFQGAKAGLLITSGGIAGGGLAAGALGFTAVAAWAGPIGIVAGVGLVLIDWKLASSKTEFYDLRENAITMFRDEFRPANSGWFSKTQTQLWRLGHNCANAGLSLSTSVSLMSP